MKIRPLIFGLIACSTSILSANTTDRISRLESQVAELQALVRQLTGKNLSRFKHSSESTHSSKQGNYEVLSGDSFWKISQKFKISLSSLEDANPGINPKRLQVGAQIRIPGQRVKSTKGRKNKSSRRSGMGTYTVQDGDILGRISENHGIRLYQLLDANPGLDAKRLQVGTVLNIPGQARTQPKPPRQPETREYSTATQRTIQKPAEQRAVTHETGNTNNPYLSASRNSNRGISSQAPEVAQRYTLQQDTRFKEIARQHYTTVAKLNKLNKVNLSPEQVIKAGSQVIVPSH